MSELIGRAGHGLDGIVSLRDTLGNSLAETVLDAYGLFSRALARASSLNPFGMPSAPPGTRAEQLEEELKRLESVLSRTSSRSAGSRKNRLILAEKLNALKQILVRSTLLPQQRTAVFEMVVVSLARRGGAGGLNRTAPDRQLFLDNLERVLSGDYHVSAPEVRHMLQDIGQFTSETKWAA